MNGLARSTQTTGEALAWYGDFYAANQRLPSVQECEALRGPTWRIRKRLGGLPGISQALGLERMAMPPRTHHSDEQLIDSLGSWLTRKGLEKPPREKEATRDYRAGDPIATPGATFAARYGSWENALSETGLFRFQWSASECVGHAYRAREASTIPDLRLAIREQSQRGVTPTLTDTLGHYASIRQLSYNRLSWDA